MRLNLGVRSKLFAISFALIAIVGLASGLYLESELRHWLEKRIESELVREALAAREQVQGASRTQLPVMAGAGWGRVRGSESCL